MITSQYFNITSDASIFASNRHISNKQHCAVWVKSLTNVWSQIPYNDFDLVNNSIILDTALLSTIYSQVELRVADSQEELGTPVTDISTTASIRDEVIVVADNIDSITTVSENIVNLNNIADNIVKAGVIADNIVDVNNVADNIVSVSSLASIRTQLESLYADKTKLTSIYNDKTTLDSIYADKSKLDAIFSDLNAIEGLFSIKAKLESIYADKSKLDSIYADKTQLDTIYNNISNILTVYSSIANVITVSNNIASVNTTASNIVDVNTFSSKYKISSIQPSSPTAGDLWYDTVATVLKYYNGSSYIAVSPDITLLLTNTKFISNISIGNTTLSNWSSSFSVMEGQGGTFFASNGVATLTGSNCYYDGVNWKYKVDGTAGLQLVNQGTHTFRTAVSGLAGATITWVTVASIDSTGLTVSNKQDTLVSGTNIKTINSSTILGSGNINLVDLTTNQTIDGVKTFSSSPIVPTPTTGTQAANKDYVDSKPTLSIGAILNAYTIFDNCIVAFGGEFNRADYPKLWAYLQANPSLVKTQAQWTTENTTNGMCGYFSGGNGTTTFRVPNLDKAFLRPDSRGVGTFQLDEFKSHNHTLAGGGYQSTSTSDSGRTGGNYAVHYSGTSGGTETRPKNIAVLPLIVAK